MCKRFISAILALIFLFDITLANGFTKDVNTTISQNENTTANQAKQEGTKTGTQNMLDRLGGKERFKLFEPARYGFLQEDKPIMLPDNKTATKDDEYFNYSRKYLENIINETEGNIQLKEKATEYIEILNPSLLLPIYGTTISLTGRKTFGFKFNSKKYDVSSTTNDQSFSNFEFQQEMQMRVQGKISDRIFVDIDYDDQRADAQNIAVAYRGKTDELVQSVDFGDIELSLPATQFLSYSKQVFGAKMHLKYGGANLHLIGSQSKGESKSKQFKGDSVFDTVNIKDLNYIRRTYYDLTFDGNWTSAIVNGSAEVWLDDHTNTGYREAKKAVDFKSCKEYPTTDATASFRLLTNGVDYTIDTNKNMLIFTSARADTDVVAINFKSIDGQWVNSVCQNAVAQNLPVLVKTPNDRPLESYTDEISYKLEIKRYYNIGTTQLTKDNGSGNFILKLLESDGREVCATSTTYDYCPNTNYVDYDKGTFYIKSLLPDSSLYNQTPVSNTNRYFFVQFNSTVKTYFLESDIVVQSETVKVNGATMARNKDYYVDYASGYITFYNKDLIGANSTIDVTYETTNASKDSSLLGGRFNYDFTKNISIGASLIQEANSKPNQVPQIGDLSTSLTTMEADARVKDLQITEGLKVSAGGEIAQSKKNQNLFGYAMIENMQEVKDYVRASNVFSDWIFGSNPMEGTSFFNTINWDSEEVRSLSINPNAVANADDKQNVLVINYDFSKLPTEYQDRDEVSIIYPINNSGADFSNKTLLEFTMLGQLNGPQINISFGTMDEASDNYDYIPEGFSPEDIFPACSKYYVAGKRTVPKTEDLRCTGQITNSEDQGWLFVNPDKSYTRYNPFANNVHNPLPQPNGIIDTQDLNGNGILDSYDPSSGGHLGFAKRVGVQSDGDLIIDPAQTGLENNIINFTGWKTFQRELDFSSSEELKNRWSSIQQMRITLKRNPMGTDKGTIKIANLAVSGSTWHPLDTDEAVLTTYGINNVDNPTYKPIYNDPGDGGEVFRTLYGSVSDLTKDSKTNNILEQSLALQYDFSRDISALTKEVSVQRNFSSMDFSQHEQFRFLLYNKSPANENSKFYLRIATDDNNYSEIEITLDFSNQWRVYQLELIDLNGDHIPDRWENKSKYPATITNEGSLNYKRVGVIKSGIRRDDSVTDASGEVWLNDIFLADAITATGTAYEADAKVVYENWFEVGGKVTYKDDLFQTPLTVASNQKNREDDYYLNFKRIKYLPIRATYYRSNTQTADVLNNTNTNTISLLDKGKVTRDKATISADYINPDYPRITAGYSVDKTNYDLIKRDDNKKNYYASVNYTPKNTSVLKNLTASADFTNNQITYDNAELISSKGTTYNTKENLQNYSLKFNLAPWKGATIVPSYSLTTATENRKFYDTSEGIEAFRNKKYSKYATQNIGLNTSLRIFSWLTPTASYVVNIKENNNLTKTTQTIQNVSYTFDIGDVKTINRNSEGNFSLALNGKDIFKNKKLLSGLSVSGNYKLQDGDAWEYVDDSFNTLDKIWLRSSLGINSPYSYRSTLTLRNTYTASTRWTPFKEYAFSGKLSPLNTISINSNFSKSDQTSENLGAMYKTTSTTLPDMVFYIDNMEKFFNTSPRYLSGTNLKLKYSSTNNKTLGTDDTESYNYGGDFRFVLFNTFDTTLSYSQKTTDKQDLIHNVPLSAYLRKDFSAQTSFNYKKVRITPKFTYIMDRQQDVNNVLVTDVTEIVPSIAIKWDFNLPLGLQLPFIAKQYMMTNRVIWNTVISYSRRRSYTVDDNRDLFDFSTNLDYELSKNIRLTLTGAFQRFKHIYIAENSYTAYSVGLVTTIQF